MGGSKTQTVGYWFPYDLQFGLCYAADAVLELRGGDATAWSGRVVSNSTIQIDAANLWGGEDNGGEGGIVGPMDLLFGGDDQEPHPYLVDQFNQGSALRGKVTALMRETRYGAYNPYPKPPAFKAERLFAAWPGGEPWYPEVAEIIAGSGHEQQAFVERFSGGLDPYEVVNGSMSAFSIVDDGGPCIQVSSGPSDFRHKIRRLLPYPAALFRVRAKFKLISMQSDDGGSFGLDDASGNVVFEFNTARQAETDPLRRPNVVFRNQAGQPGNPIGEGPVELGRWYAFDALYDRRDGRFVVRITDAITGALFGAVTLTVSARSAVHALTFVSDNFSGAGSCRFDDIEVLVGDFNGTMNPAHMLYYSFVSPTMEGLPAGQLDDASWRRAADVLHMERFGLCTEWVPGAESVDQFRQRICNVIGGFLNKSRRDGKWRLHLPRGDYELEALPVLTDDDILEWKEEPSTLDDAVNQVQTKWFDPTLKKGRITPVATATSMVEAFGGIITQTLEYPEIPNEGLAMRVNVREKDARSTPLKRFSLICSRKPAQWDEGTYFRLQCPRRGIADMVLLLLRVEVGDSPSAAVKLVASEDIYTMPSSTHLGPQDPVEFNPPMIPLPAEDQLAFEAPYLVLAAALPHGELAAVPPEAGYLQFVAARPASGINFVLTTAATGEEFEEHGVGDWCPTARIVEGDTLEAGPETEFTITAGARLGDVSIGSLAVWGDELCRVDALDAAAGTVELGRGCGDTVPRQHSAGDRIWFVGDWAATDMREYALGETVLAKALTRTRGDRLAPSDAPTSLVLMDERQVRPYPPGNLKVEDSHAPVDPVTSPFEVTWAHRDRLLQADQVVDWQAGDIGPEPGTEYVLRFYAEADDALLLETDPTSAAAAEVSLGYTGIVRLEAESTRDGLVSWQQAAVKFLHLEEDLDPIQILGDLPPGAPGTPYEAELVVTGAIGSVTYTVVDGELPPGITIDELASTPTKVVFTGTPEDPE